MAGRVVYRIDELHFEDICKSLKPYLPILRMIAQIYYLSLLNK